VIERLATVGAMFAASILLGRALQPVEQLVPKFFRPVSRVALEHELPVALASGLQACP